MYGLINRFVALPEQRDELIGLMLGEEAAIPGCLSFVVAREPGDPDALWITEVWESKAHWEASLELPAIKASIERAMPLIASFGEPRETEPVGLIPRP